MPAIAQMPVYDAAGDLANDGRNQYLYDAEGRVCAIQSPSVGGMPAGMTQYLYDAAGKKIPCTKSEREELVRRIMPRIDAINAFLAEHDDVPATSLGALAETASEAKISLHAVKH